ncbi:ATP-grasp domain-containing protein [Breoghania sp. L-A4]|uniref:ATP-grasp domain-containing protein n=1 Tax=Breoghania sp. L-A4 TaxID=2304600 RepID=UPI0013C33F63|nr:ATP-grasp domain-containing protein [Breoghania sp. L-A4]
MTTPDAAQRPDSFIAILDPGTAHFRYLRSAREMGYKTIVMSADPDAYRAEQALYKQRVPEYDEAWTDVFVPYDSPDPDTLTRLLEPYRGRIAGVIAGDEFPVPAAARLGRALGFNYATPEDADCQRDKSAMKRRLIERGVPTARYRTAESLPDALATWEAFGGDCMVKMVDYASSFNVFRVRSREELENAWYTIVENRRGLQVAFDLAQKVIVEEFIGGRELTVEGYVQDGRVEVLNFCEKITNENFLVIGHYIPARVTKAESDALAGIARQCVAALGVQNTIFHAEVHLRDGQPFIIECAARTPGQHSVEIIERTYGIDLMTINIDLAMGRFVSTRRRPPEAWHALLALYATESGTLKEIKGLEALKQREDLVWLALDVAPGQPVRKLETFKDLCGLAVVGGPAPEDAEAGYCWIRENLVFVVEDGA